MDKHKAEDVTRRLVRFRNISVLLAWLVMPLPFVVYFTNNFHVLILYPYQKEAGNLIWIMILTNILAYVAVSLWTIQIATQTFFSNNLKEIIPVRFLNRPVIARWWSAVQQTWRWNVLATIPRLGLVMGIAQLFAADVEFACQQLNIAKLLFQPYCYYSGYHLSNQQDLNLLIGCVVILLFAYFNCVLLCSLTHNLVLSNPYLAIRSIFAKRMKVALVFATIIFVFEFAFVMMQPLVDYKGIPFLCENNFYGGRIPYGTCWAFRRVTAEQKVTLASFNLYDWIEHIEVVSWSLVDNGTMLTSNIMSLRGDSPILASRSVGNIHVPPTLESAIEYLQYFASQLLLAIISLSLMALQTYRYLRRMERLDSGGHAHGQA